MDPQHCIIVFLTAILLCFAAFFLSLFSTLAFLLSKEHLYDLYFSRGLLDASVLASLFVAKL
jgi:hypothetical protein